MDFFFSFKSWIQQQKITAVKLIDFEFQLSIQKKKSVLKNKLTEIRKKNEFVYLLNFNLIFVKFGEVASYTTMHQTVNIEIQNNLLLFNTLEMDFFLLFCWLSVKKVLYFLCCLNIFFPLY